jgi:hypothetical protein
MHNNTHGNFLKKKDREKIVSHEKKIKMERISENSFSFAIFCCGIFKIVFLSNCCLDPKIFQGIHFL